MKVPNAERAVVDRDKLTAYCLNPTHEVGGHKARVFASALGLKVENTDVLQDALLFAVRTEEAEQVEHPYGEVFVVDFALEHANRSATVRSVWIIDRESEIPRLVTCFVV